MTKSPEEIKRGLETCYGEGSCDECPYHLVVEGSFGCDEMGCDDSLMPDAMAYIQQLEADNAKNARCIENLTGKLNAVNGEAAKWKAERDAAVELLQMHCGCLVCKYQATEIDHEPCCECTFGNGEVIDSNWEWSGVQKEDAHG